MGTLGQLRGLPRFCALATFLIAQCTLQTGKCPVMCTSHAGVVLSSRVRTTSCVGPVRQRQLVCLQQSSVLEELKLLGVRPKKSLGQNFLISEAVLSDIVTAASVQAGDHILEIGPGLGTLTDRLVKVGATVLAIEKDDLFYKHLEQKFAEVWQTYMLLAHNTDTGHRMADSHGAGHCYSGNPGDCRAW